MKGYDGDDDGGDDDDNDDGDDDNDGGSVGDVAVGGNCFKHQRVKKQTKTFIMISSKTSTV